MDSLLLLARRAVEGGADNDDPAGTPRLSWANVAIAACFILLNCIISYFLELRLEKSLVIAATRCLVQLTIMGFILEDVFKAKNVYLVLLLAVVLILLGAFETVYNKSKNSYDGMFLSVLMSTAVSTVFVGVIGARFAMGQQPFWTPETFIPTMGMLLGNLLSGMAVALGYCLSTVGSNKEQIETYLAFGASRWEAGQSIAREAVRLAMLPTINQMSIIGLISLPGMMAGSILGGAPIMNAVRYQQIIMFMISAATAMGVLGAVYASIQVVIDGQDRLRPERIISGRPSLWNDVKMVAKKLYSAIACCGRRKSRAANAEDDHDSDNDDNTDDDQARPLLRS
ncbi:hypothetical protein BC940DRAFT_250976 [Gongronella butleri]|nr:hypothetical protein BC940DRAFT_250976 [Gongronella butleri]